MPTFRIREFQMGDEAALHAVFYSAVHQIASADYNVEEIQAWAPAAVEVELWARRMRELRPFIVEQELRIVAYADLQPTGYIDHFYVAGSHARQGIGALLMGHILQVARAQSIKTLTSNVSRTAQPFFEKFGFIVIEPRSPLVRGVAVPNAFMRKELLNTSL